MLKVTRLDMEMRLNLIPHIDKARALALSHVLGLESLLLFVVLGIRLGPHLAVWRGYSGEMCAVLREPCARDSNQSWRHARHVPYLLSHFSGPRICAPNPTHCGQMLMLCYE